MKINLKLNGNSTLVGTLVPVGSRHEPDNIKGISHFLEHMLFKGTKNRNMTELKQAIDRYGATFNAWTAEEHTFYYVVIANKYKDNAREIIDDMIENSIFPEEEFEKEKQVVLQELEMYNDNPRSYLFENIQRHIIPKYSGLHIPIIGTRESVKSITRQDLINHYQTYYKNNVKITVGDTENYIGDNIKTKKLFLKEDKKYLSDDTILNRAGVNQANMAVSGLLYLDTFKEMFLLELYSAILNGFCGRLFDVIREKNNLVYHTRFYFELFSCNTVLYSCYAGLKPEKIQFAKQLMLEQLSKKVTKEELDFAKSKVIGQHNLSVDDKSYLARQVIECFLTETNLDEFIKNYEKNINSLTVEDINNFIQKVNFNDSKLIAVIPER